MELSTTSPLYSVSPLDGALRPSTAAELYQRAGWEEASAAWHARTQPRSRTPSKDFFQPHFVSKGATDKAGMSLTAAEAGGKVAAAASQSADETLAAIRAAGREGGPPATATHRNQGSAVFVAPTARALTEAERAAMQRAVAGKLQHFARLFREDAAVATAGAARPPTAPEPSASGPGPQQRGGPAAGFNAHALRRRQQQQQQQQQQRPSTCGEPTRRPFPPSHGGTGTRTGPALPAGFGALSSGSSSWPGPAKAAAAPWQQLGGSGAEAGWKLGAEPGAQRPNTSPAVGGHRLRAMGGPAWDGERPQPRRGPFSAADVTTSATLALQQEKQQQLRGGRGAASATTDALLRLDPRLLAPGTVPGHGPQEQQHPQHPQHLQHPQHPQRPQQAASKRRWKQPSQAAESPNFPLPSPVPHATSRLAAMASDSPQPGAMGGRPSHPDVPAVLAPCTTAVRACGPAPHQRPSRGAIYSIFQDLDRFGEGRVTYSVFEEAAVQVGLKKDQVQRLFRRLDPRGKGYVTVREWGQPAVESQLAEFTRLFVTKTRAPNGRYKGTQEVQSLYAALQMAMFKLQLKNSGRSVSHERLVEAFEFLDRDLNGSLDRREVVDAFNGMGIYMPQQVLDEAMAMFDKDGDGTVDYAEFISALYPNLSKGCKMRD